jgi:hypothetical protein
MNTHLLLPKLIAAVMSLLDQANLRNRVYEQAHRIEILETALEDISRISTSRVDSSERLSLIEGICTRVRDRHEQ